MSLEVIECEEFEEVHLRVAALIEAGELKLDERITGRGFLAISLKQGEIILRADRHVGLIPVNDKVAVRVRPRANIANLSYMLAHSGVAPLAISGFSRGYLPRFENSETVSEVYATSLIEGCERILKRGLMKGYQEEVNPPPFRGRLLATDTVRKHRSRGTRYRHEFSYSTLSTATIENQGLKAAISVLIKSLRENGDRRKLLPSAVNVGKEFSRVPHWRGRPSGLVSALGERIGVLPPQLGFYRDSLWTAYLLLQEALPDVGSDGSITLDSLIIDVSKVFEAYTRRCIFDEASEHGLQIFDGNLRPSSFFIDEGAYTVHPDIVVVRDGRPIAVLDAKYKLSPKESDRYELLSFMDTMKVDIGGFICPTVADSTSRYMGITAGGKAMSVLRFDLAAPDPLAEAHRLFRNVERMIDGNKMLE